MMQCKTVRASRTVHRLELRSACHQARRELLSFVVQLATGCQKVAESAQMEMVPAVDCVTLKPPQEPELELCELSLAEIQARLLPPTCRLPFLLKPHTDGFRSGCGSTAHRRRARVHPPRGLARLAVRRHR